MSSRLSGSQQRKSDGRTDVLSLQLCFICWLHCAAVMFCSQLLLVHAWLSCGALVVCFLLLRSIQGDDFNNVQLQGCGRQQWRRQWIWRSRRPYISSKLFAAVVDTIQQLGVRWRISTASGCFLPFPSLSFFLPFSSLLPALFHPSPPRSSPPQIQLGDLGKRC